jgi:hypothetical protein
MLNTFGGAYFFSMVTGADLYRLFVILSIAYALVAVAAVMLGNRRATARLDAGEDVQELVHA